MTSLHVQLVVACDFFGDISNCSISNQYLNLFAFAIPYGFSVMLCCHLDIITYRWSASLTASVGKLGLIS